MLDHILAFSVRNRWLVVFVTFAAALVGFFMLPRLPIDAVPDVTNNQVVINTSAPGLGPDEMEKLVTFPIESALAGTTGLLETRSLSRNGFSQVTAIFGDDVNVYFARQQVSERLREAREQLPPGLEPALGPVATGLSNVHLWALTFEHPDGKGATPRDGEPGWQTDGSYLTPDGDKLKTETERLTYLRTIQDWVVKPQIKQVKNVADVDVLGGYVKQYVVLPNPERLQQFGLAMTDLADALDRNNRTGGGSFIERNGSAYLVKIDGRIKTEADIAGIPVAVRNGTPILVSQVAEVTIGHDVRSGATSLNGRESVSGIALMLIGANSRQVASEVEAKLHQITLPPDMVALTILNRTTLVDSTIHTVSVNLVEGAVLVVVVLLLLLGNIRAAVITAMAIPLSMLLTATGMVATKISGNLMSLGAIDFGLIVDGAVIIVENCMRRLAERQHELGRPLNRTERLETVLAGSRQVRSATAFGEAIIIIVYLPILTLAGVEGKMFWPMAMTVVLALVAAFVLSLTFVPAAVAIVMTGRIREAENPLIRIARRLYEPTLRVALRARVPVVVVAALLLVATVFGYSKLGAVFIPRLDEGDVNITTMRIPSTSLAEALRLQQQIERVLREKVPEAVNVLSATGTGDIAQDAMPQFSADTFVILKPRSMWRSVSELAKAIDERETQLKAAGLLKEKPADAKADPDDPDEQALDHKGLLVKLMQLELAIVPGTHLEFSQPIEDRFNELIAGVRSDVAVEVYGEDFDEIRPAAEQVAGILRKLNGQDVKVEQTDGLPVVDVRVDRAIVRRLGVSVGDVTDLIETAVSGKKTGVIYEGDRRFDVVVRLPEALRNDPQALAALGVPLPKAGGSDRVSFVPLSSLASFHTGEQRYEITRKNGKRHIIVQCNVRGRDLGSFVADAQKRIHAEVKLKPGNWLEWGGQFENYASARLRLMIVVPAALVLIFALLYLTFFSVVDALLVFSGVPLALTGGVAALLLREMPFSISAGVGFIALSGVAVLNGLVMVSFIRQLRSAGKPLDEAVYEGCVTRLRPVLMTALVAALGFLPMTLATGSGAEVQRPLATVVIGGIISCTLLTLVVLPALYRLVHRERSAA